MPFMSQCVCEFSIRSVSCTVPSGETLAVAVVRVGLLLTFAALQVTAIEIDDC